MKNITKILVLLRKITLEDATRLVNSKKTSQFGTTLLRPKKIPFKVKIKEKIPLRKGSIAYVPAGTLHTHGSVKKSEIFSHIALNLADKRGAFKTLWYESDLAGMVIKKI